MVSTRDGKDFISGVIGDNLLDDAIDWISSHLEPDDIFDEYSLGEWAERNGYVKEE